MRSYLLTCLTLVFTLSNFFSVAAHADGKAKRVQLFFTGDITGYLKPCG